MSYFVRAICTSQTPPSLLVAQQWLRERNSPATIGAADLDSPEWDQASLSYKTGKRPILIDCNRDTGKGCLMREELDELFESVEDAEPSPAKKQVLAHLAASRFIVACQLPTSDIDDDGYYANGEFLSFFVQHYGGMIQADGEGFYAGQRLLLEVT